MVAFAEVNQSMHCVYHYMSPRVSYIGKISTAELDTGRLGKGPPLDNSSISHFRFGLGLGLSIICQNLTECFPFYRLPMTPVRFP